MNIVTSICVDTSEDDRKINYPMLENKSDKKITYWRCVVTFCLTSLRVNPTKKHLVFTNDEEEVLIGDYNVKEELKNKGVEIKYLPFNDFNPGQHSKRFKNAFYKLEVISALADLTEPSLLLDSDVIWTKKDDRLIEMIEKGEFILLQDTYQRNNTPNKKSPHNLSMEDMGKLYATIPVLENQPKYPIWYGGELIAGSPKNLKHISKNLKKVMDYCGKQMDTGEEISFNNGASILDNDEYVSSSVFNSLSDIRIFDTQNVFSKRIQTASISNNIKKEDINLTIWHLPAEKETGLKEIFEDIRNDTSTFWDTKTDIVSFLGEYVRIINPRKRIAGFELFIFRVRKVLRRISKKISSS